MRIEKRKDKKTKKRKRSPALNLSSVPHTHHTCMKGQPKRFQCRPENQCLAIRWCCTRYLKWPLATQALMHMYTFLIIFIFRKNIKLLLKELDYNKKKNMIKKLMESSLAKFAFRDNLFVLPLKKKKTK